MNSFVLPEAPTVISLVRDVACQDCQHVIVNKKRKLLNAAAQSYLLDNKTDSDRSTQNAYVFIEKRPHCKCFFSLQLGFPLSCALRCEILSSTACMFTISMFSTCELSLF